MLRAAARQLEHRVSEAAAQCCAPAARAGLAAAWAGRSSSDPAKSCRSAWARCVSNSAAVACVAGGKGAAEAAAAQHSEKQSKLFRKVLDGAFRAHTSRACSAPLAPRHASTSSIPAFGCYYVLVGDARVTDYSAVPSAF